VLDLVNGGVSAVNPLLSRLADRDSVEVITSIDGASPCWLW
jgi:hypothetical protein